MSEPRVIKKYPNRRLYDTHESRYITLAEIKQLVIGQIEFLVLDKKSGQNITRSILLQVIADQEQQGDAAMSEAFLAQLIRLYGSAQSPQLAAHLERSVREFGAANG